MYGDIILAGKAVHISAGLEFHDSLMDRFETWHMGVHFLHIRRWVL